MKGSFRSLFQKYCLESSVLGLKYLKSYPDKLSRCFWTINITVVLYLAFLLTFLLYHRYAENPTRIAIENQFEPVTEMPYPAITLCTPNQLTISGMKHFNRTLIDGNNTINLEDILHQLLGFYQFMHVDEDVLNHLQTLVELNRYTVTEVLRTLPQRCDKFLKVCLFQKRRYPSCLGLFRPILTTYGLCCIFNSKYYYKGNRRNERENEFTPLKVKQSGLLEGLTVVTDYEPEDAVDGTIVFAGAVRVMFTDWTEFPADDETNMVFPDTESFHAISATYTYCSQDVKDLDVESRKCNFKDEYNNHYFLEYRNSDCDLMCVVRAVEQRCKCLLFFLPNLRVQQTCNITNIPCIIDVRLNMNSWQQTGACDCLRDCEERSYNVALTVGNLDALPYLLKNHYAELVFNKSTSIMHFFFPSQTYKKKKQETVMSLTVLVSNLGGVFGLCMGCSVISVMEMMFYLYVAVRNWIQGRLRRAWFRRRRVAIGYIE